MWAELVKDLLEGMLEAWAGDRLEVKRRARLNRQLEPVIKQTMSTFADTSLDCDAFYRLVRSGRFSELMRNLFFSLDDRMGNQAYMDRVEEYILRECPTVKLVEARAFLQAVAGFYEEHLSQVMEQTPEVYALFQMMIRSNREIIAKISESEEALRRYMESRGDTGRRIDDADIEEYHRVCEKLYAEVRFTGISGAESKRTQNINDFYVENSFSYYGREFRALEQEKQTALRTLRLGDFFKNGSKVVLIGAAGLGKSTTLNYLFCNYERVCGAYAVKIKLDLKECAEDVERGRRDILGCITAEFYKKIKRKNLSFEDAESLLAGFLEKGRCLVIFDALDEIPTQAVRNKARDEIASFCELYYLNRFIISTREVGYLRNRFDDSFLHIRINEFNDEQVERYSRNWYGAYYGEAAGAARGEEAAFADFWGKFQVEAARARCLDMIRNPIILILALVIFDIEKSLPNRRVEFYKKCIETFLTVREDRKAAFKLSRKAKNILAMERVVPRVAYYQFSHVERNAGYRFSYDGLREAVFSAINVQDRVNWSAAVEEYGRYLVERTELIREVDEDALDFAHKTFYEYFLAVYFTKQYAPDDLCGLLEGWIGDANYDEMARLIIEVVIQNDDPWRHEKIMAFLFAKIEDRRHGGAIISILAALYADNLLHPQYHTDYHRSILYHARFVEREGRQYLYKRREPVRYDEELLAELYCEALAEEDGFGRTLDALYYLDNGFRNAVLRRLGKSRLTPVVNLMTLARRGSAGFSVGGGTNASMARPETLGYFLGEGLSYTLEYPQIYLSVVTVMARNGRFSRVERLLAPRFQAGNFFHYIGVEGTRTLLEGMSGIPELLPLLLICLIHCARGWTNFWLVRQVQGARYYGRASLARRESVYNTGIWLGSVLYQTEDYGEFRAALMDKGLYLEAYGDLYQELYKAYVSNEKALNAERTERLFGSKATTEWRQTRIKGFSI